MAGIAESCCAHFLKGLPVHFAPAAKAMVPAIVVSQATQSLLGDVFKKPGLFADLPRINQRIVAWNAPAVALPHAAVVISEQALAARLNVELKSDSTATWTIHTAKAPTQIQHFGKRRATVVAVELKDASATCWVESLSQGWLFLIPGWLIAVGGAPETLLAESSLVVEQVRSITGQAAEFAAYPRISDPLAASEASHNSLASGPWPLAPAWLAAGAAAMAFDPICGDGTGAAIREAILAAAVIRAAHRGENPDALLAHYRARLIAAFRRHLELALDFYRAGNAGPWWVEEIEAMERGIAWCTAQRPTFLYRLNGFDLEPLTAR